MDSIEVLQELASQVRNAKQEGENTAERVGRLLEGIVERLGGGYFTLQTDANGMTYLHTEYSLAVMGGLTTFARSSAVVPSIFEGIPIDNDTIYWDESTGVKILKAKGSDGGSDFDATKMWSALSAATNEQINKSHLTTALSGYAIKSDLNISNWDAAYSWGNHAAAGYAKQTALDDVSTKLNDFLEGSDTDTIINKWKELEAFLAGMSETDNLAEILATKADKSYVDTELTKYVTLATEQTIDGLKHFTNGLTIGATKHKIYEKDGNILIEGNVLVTGGITAYSDGSSSGGSSGGLDVDLMWQILGSESDEQIHKSHLTTALSGYATESWVTSQNYLTSVNWSQIQNKPTTLGGYGITDAYTKTDSDNRFVNVSGDTMTGALIVSSGGIVASSRHGNGVKLAGDNVGGWVQFGSMSASPTNKVGTISAFEGYNLTSLNIRISNNGLTVNENKVWHAGNDGHGSGLDADLLDGLQVSSFFRENLLAKQNLDADNLDTYYAQYNPIGDMNTWDGTSFTNFPKSKPAGGFSLLVLREGNYKKQIYSDYNDNHLYTRTQYYSNGIKWNNWSTVALTTDNVASATKLETARTIWGQSFDGTQDVNGTINGAPAIELYYSTPFIDFHYNNSPDDYTSRIIETASGLLLFTHNIAVSGNVGIGTSSPTQKLDINGTAKAKALMSYHVRIECDNNGVFGSRGGEINNYDMPLQLQYNTSQQLHLCYGGGNVGIGTISPSYKLDVAGAMHVSNTSVFGNNVTLNGSESNNITTSYRDNGSITNIGESTAGIRHSLNFKWYSTEWYIGNIRGGSSNSMGFGVVNGSTCYLRVNTDTTTVYGNILATGGITCYASDQRAKTVIEQIKLSLKQIANAPTIRFKWNDWKIKDDGKTHIGGIAQYMQKLLPETVLEADDMLNMDYATTGYIFAVQTAKHLVKTDTEVEKLKKRVKKLEKQLKQLGYEEVNIMDD